MIDSPKLRARARFRPPLWATLLTAALLAAMVALGFWQLGRAEQKQQMLADFEAAVERAPEGLDEPAPPADSAPAHVRVEGRYLGGGQLLLDNQIRDGLPGVRVWTPLRRDSGEIILVDRGWVAAPSRERLPDNLAVGSEQRRVSGLWRPLPEAGLSLGNSLCQQPEAPQRVQYPTVEEIACRFDGPLADGLLLLDPEASDGFQRQWRPDHLDPKVHWGYALQWFGFAVALLVIFFVVNRKAE
ncbi:SURF1 family protein [Algiphilus aromaticivorans]|uniref:SURF1 family protein n=1 Tax=Algiphilus aromaticivorans TaxID=382454 RepID=UPI000A001208|nr:SURF1 family protein [Algiphilus aromaticivorans]